MRRGEILFTILERLSEAAIDAADMFDAFLTAGYGASVGKIEYEFRRRKRTRNRGSQSRLHEAALRRRYYDMVYRLKRDGLIEETSKKTRKFFSITAEGLRKLSHLRSSRRERLPLPLYSKEEGARWLIVAFDIPEREKRKREWMRTALRNLGFTMVQRSLWKGRIKVPRKFLEDIRRLNLVNCIEIFEISETGTLREVV